MDGPGQALRRAGVAALLAALQACGGPKELPEAGESQGAVPDLSGARVMVFPVQAGPGLPGDVEAEMGFALEGRAPAVSWVFPDELRRAAANSPGYDVVVDDLPVGVFLQAEVRRVGDPLYGYLRRLGALVDADAALIPILLQYRLPPPPEPTEERASEAGETVAAPEPGRGEVTVALISLVSGRVYWFGVVAGQPGPVSDPAVLASTMDALARRLGQAGAR
jgi:hypothetical protein